MRYSFSPEDEAFRKEARAWLAKNKPPARCPAEGPESRRFTTEWLRRLHASGWSGISWPVEYGGKGFSLERQMIWYEEYVRSCAPSPLNPSFVSLNHAGPTLIARGSEEQKAFHLPKILSGEALWCQGFSEPGSGSDLASLRASGRIEGDSLVVNGQKIWSSYADVADYQELLIRTEPGAMGHKGLSWVICDMRSPGITIRPIENLAGTAHFAEIFYDDVRIPLTNVVGALGEGWSVAMTTLSFERGTAAVALQLELLRKIESIRLTLTDYGAAASYALQSRIAAARAEAVALRALTYKTFFSEPASPFDGSIVRLFFAELAQRIHRIAMDAAGGSSMDFDGMAPWAEDYLEAFSETIAGGTCGDSTQHHQRKAARHAEAGARMSIDLNLSADQVQILESVRSVLHDKFPVARLRKRRNGEADRAALRDMAAQGWIGLGIDERLGGAGFSLVEDALLFRETGRRLVTPSLFASAMAARVAIACDQPDLAAGILDGSIRVCLANSIAYGLHGNSPDCFLYDAEDAQWALLITPSSLQLLGIDAFASIKRAQCADRSVSLRRAFLQPDNGRTVSFRELNASPAREPAHQRSAPRPVRSGSRSQR